MKTKIRGCYPALVTPMKRGDSVSCSINYKALDKLMEYVLSGNVDGVIVAGCTGAASTLDHDEQVGLVRYVRENWGDKTTVIAGDGSNSTREAIELAKRMEGDAGVFTHLQISPYYNKPSDRGIRQHYEMVADAIEGEMIIYSVPGRTCGKGILPCVAEQLADHPRIIGIKEASGDLPRIKETIERTREKDFFVVSGDDGKSVEIIRAGGTGVISVATNIIPGYMSRLIHAALEDDFETAENIDSKLKPLYAALFLKSESNQSPNPSTTHYILRRKGIDVGIPRLPLTDLESQEADEIDAVLEKLRDYIF